MSTKMTSRELRQKYLEFFKDKGHAIIPPSPLVPQNDPTTLFTSSGMQPLVPYLLGEEHPAGTRLVDSQPSFRAQDIDEVGDNRHTTFFEMLGNWSLGDYFKEEQLTWFWSFLTEELGIDPQKLYVSTFIGDAENNVPKDETAAEVWKKLFKEKGIDAKVVEIGSEEEGYKKGMQGGRIFYYDAKKNWWSRAGTPSNMPAGEPGGPDSEVFYEFTEVEHDIKFGEHCHPNCDCGRFLEIGNSVFMQYVKQDDGSFKPLPKQNVDFGGGLERILAVVDNQLDVFRTDLFLPVVTVLEQASGMTYEVEEKAMRIIADHLKAATVMLAQGIRPSNKFQGYVLRRLIRRAAVKMRKLSGMTLQVEPFTQIGEVILDMYDGVILDKEKVTDAVIQQLTEEVHKFAKTLERGLQQLEKMKVENITEAVAFDLFQTYGFPFEITQELVAEKGGSLSKVAFDAEFEKHQQKSRTAAEGIFKGGLADHSDAVLKYHTATHLLHAALRKVLGTHVQQKGSNITGERLRFDFSHEGKISESQLAEVERLVNEKIKEDLPVRFAIQPYEAALKQGALAFFGEKYPEQVKVYTIGNPEGEWFSKELCGGPHVDHTGEIGRMKITKESSAGAGVRRIYAELA